MTPGRHLVCSGYRLGAVPDCVEGSPKRGDYALTTVLPTSRIPFSSSLKSYLSFRSKPLDEPPNPALSRYYLTLYPKREEQHRVLQECADLAPERLGPAVPVSYTHLRAHETVLDLVCRLLLE